MQHILEQLEPLVSVDDQLCLLPEDSGVIQVTCRLKPGAPAGWIPESLPEEIQDYLNNVVPKRRHQFLAGRYCAAHAIQSASATATLWVGRAANGMPCWPEGLTGSISHCGSNAIAAVAHSDSVVAIGVDMENRMGQEQAERLAERILARYPRCDSFNDRSLLVTLTFSIKEALYKALNPLGMIESEFDAADIVEWDHQNGKCRIELRKSSTGNINHDSYFLADYAFNDTLVQSRVILRPPTVGGMASSPGCV